MSDVQVVCVKWGNRYAPEYVNHLHNAVSRNLTIPHDFICVTEDSSNLNSNIIVLPLIDNSLKGWWQKLSLFKPNALENKPTLFIDLDMVIVNSIDDFFTYGNPDKFAAPRRFRRWQELRMTSAIMRFMPKDCEFIWKSFVGHVFNLNKFMSTVPGRIERCYGPIIIDKQPAPYYDKKYMKKMGFQWIVDRLAKSSIFGDQDVIGACMNKRPDMIWYPNEWTFGYKQGQRNYGMNPKLSKICAFAGDLDPHMVDDNWIKENWR